MVAAVAEAAGPELRRPLSSTGSPYWSSPELMESPLAPAVCKEETSRPAKHSSLLHWVTAPVQDMLRGIFHQKEPVSSHAAPQPTTASPSTQDLVDELSYLCQREPAGVSSNYLDGAHAGCIQRRHREAIVHFITEMGERLSIEPQIISRALLYFDQYASMRVKTHGGVPKREAQDVATSCLRLAVKYELDGKPLRLSVLRSICAERLDAKVLAATEVDILEVLQWKLNVPTPSMVLGCVTGLLPSCSQIAVLHAQAMLVIDFAAFDADFLDYPAPLLALASLIFSSQWLDVSDVFDEEQSARLCHLTNTSATALDSCTAALSGFYRKHMGTDEQPAMSTKSATPSPLQCRLAAATPPLGRVSPDSILVTPTGSGSS